MKDNTFNVPAYNFSIIIMNQPAIQKEVNECEYNRAMKQDAVSIIPFDNVDGLTVEETLKTLQRDDFAVCCTANWKTQTGINQVTLLDTLIFPSSVLRKSLTVSIDQLVENNYERRYMEAKESTRRIYRCFFERYQDNNHQETKERVKKISN